MHSGLVSLKILNWSGFRKLHKVNVLEKKKLKYKNIQPLFL